MCAASVRAGRVIQGLCHTPFCSNWLRTNGVNTNGVTAKVLVFDGFEQVLKTYVLKIDDTQRLAETGRSLFFWARGTRGLAARPLFYFAPREAAALYHKLFTLLDVCVSSLRRGHANLLCIVPILTDDPRRESAAALYHIMLEYNMLLNRQQTRASTHPPTLGPWSVR